MTSVDVQLLKISIARIFWVRSSTTFHHRYKRRPSQVWAVHEVAIQNVIRMDGCHQSDLVFRHPPLTRWFRSASPNGTDHRQLPPLGLGPQHIGDGGAAPAVPI